MAKYTRFATRRRGRASRSAARAPTRRSRYSTKVVTSLNQRILNVVRKNQETKRIVANPFNSTSGSLATATTFTTAITSTNELYAIIPPVTQGVQDWQRIADSIQPTSLKVDVILGLGLDIQTAIDIYVDVYFLTAKDVKSELLWNQVSTGNMLRSYLGVTTGYTGDALVANMPINHEQFTLLKHKRVRLRKGIGFANDYIANGPSPGADPTSLNSLDQSSAKFSCNFKLPKLNYSTENVSVPVNYYPFMCIGWHFAGDGGDTISNRSPVYARALSYMTFKDS